MVPHDAIPRPWIRAGHFFLILSLSGSELSAIVLISYYSHREPYVELNSRWIKKWDRSKSGSFKGSGTGLWVFVRGRDMRDVQLEMGLWRVRRGFWSRYIVTRYHKIVGDKKMLTGVYCERFLAGNVSELGVISTCPTRLIRFLRSRYFLSSLSNFSLLQDSSIQTTAPYAHTLPHPTQYVIPIILPSKLLRFSIFSFPGEYTTWNKENDDIPNLKQHL